MGVTPSAEKHAQARRSGQITKACLDNGMSWPDACETAAVVLPLLDAMLAEAWDEGWLAAQEVLDFEGRKVWAHTVLPEGYEGNPYHVLLPVEGDRS